MVQQYLSILQQYVPSPWAQAGIILVIFVVLAKIVQVVIDKIILHFTRKTKTTVDDIIIERTKRPLFYLVLAIGARTSLAVLGINSIIENIVESVGALFFIYILGVLLSTIVYSWGSALAKKTKIHVDDTLVPLLQRSVKVLFLVIALLWIMDIWNVNITPYLAGLGIGGLVLGLAFQDSLKNIFGGVSLIIDRNFNIGDPVKLESGEMGVIKDIGLRSTKLLTYNNELVFIPNGQLANMRITNFIAPNPRIRKIVEFSVVYGSDVGEVKDVVLKALKGIKDIYDDPYMDVVLTQMGESGLHLQARFWADWSNGYDKWVEATTAIYNALNKAKIEIPFPTRTVYMKKE